MRALIAGSLPAPAAAGPNVLHVPADLFAAGGPLGSLGINDCRIVLADGPGGSLLRVSPAMARLGFRDIPFTLPPLEQEVAFGPLATTLRLRIPGRDPADPATTIQSTRVTMRIAGASVELTAVFEPQGPEMTGEYYAVDPRTGKERVGARARRGGRRPDDHGLLPDPGAGRGAGSRGADGDRRLLVRRVRAAGGPAWRWTAPSRRTWSDRPLERAVANALNLEAYRAPLAAAVTTWLREGPFQGLPLREIRLQPTADGGLDLLPITTADP